MHEALSEAFKRFARDECHNSSPLYERLSLAIAKDPELLRLAAHARKGERVPNLSFAAVQFLLLKGIKHPVVRFYRNISAEPQTGEDPYPDFRSFALEHQQEISQLISSRWVQTNEVGRCACLLPLFAVVSQECYQRPLYMIEIGAAAGLLLLWDHYGYKYGEGLECGNRNSPLQIECGLQGQGSPPIPDVLPKVSGRLGIDLNPIDVRDPDSRRWLRALIWPEHKERARMLDCAIKVAQRDPPPLVAGDAVKVLPDILASVPPDVALCILRVWTSLPQSAREQLSSLLAEYGNKRDLFLVSTVGQRGNEIDLQLTSFVKGVKTVKVLARCETHGERLEWLVR